MIQGPEHMKQVHSLSLALLDIAWKLCCGGGNGLGEDAELAAANWLEVGCQNDPMFQDGPKEGPTTTAAPPQAQRDFGLPLPQGQTSSLVLHCSVHSCGENSVLWL